jgi:hypothetical protein
VVVKRSTAIRHLTEVADTAGDRLELHASDFGWPLEEMWMAGELLEPVDELDHGSVVLTIDLPPEELPWLAVQPTAEWIGDQLRLDKRPLSWCYRPIAWPPWTYRHRRVVRFWSAATGIDVDTIDALRQRRAVEVVEPDRDALATQLDVERAVARTHLQSILDTYWDRDWRRDNRYGTSPEDQLWRAATALTEIDSALDDLTR